MDTQEAILRDIAGVRFPGRDLEVFRDVGSGRTDKRAGYRRVMSLARRGKIEAILAVDADRVWRSQEALTNALRDLGDRGVAVVLVNMGLDTSTTLGRYIAQLLVATGEFESRQIGERVMRAHAANRKAGRKGPGHRPYGWDVGEDGLLVVNEGEQRTINWALARRAGGAKWSTIAGELNMLKSKTATGRTWTPEGASAVFRAAAKRMGDASPPG